MYWKETGGVEKLFSLPSRCIPARSLFNNYNRQLLSHSTFLEDFSSVAPMDILALEFYSQDNENSLIILTKKGRKRKNELSTQQFTDHVADSIIQGLDGPDVLREDQKSFGLSVATLNMAPKHQKSLSQNESNLFDNMRSPEVLSFNDMEQFTSISELPLTPRNTNQDIGDDFNQGDSTPAELDHGQTTPQHIIDSIPNIPTDQISSIFKESVTRSRVDNNISKGWNNYEISTLIGQVRLIELY